MKARLKELDAEDAMLALGIASAEAAAYVIWWPAALILLSLFCFASVYLIELEKKRTPKNKERD